MTGRASPGSSPVADRPSDDRLDSWKEIAAYLKRDVTTVQRWEKREGLPVHRHLHDKSGSVFARRGELDAWRRARTRAPDPAAEPVDAEHDRAAAPDRGPQGPHEYENGAGQPRVGPPAPVPTPESTRRALLFG